MGTPPHLLSAMELITPTAEQVRSTRSQAGLTQRESAEKVGVTLKGWQHWEYGIRTMSPAAWALYRLRTRRLRSLNAGQHHEPVTELTGDEP